MSIDEVSASTFQRLVSEEEIAKKEYYTERLTALTCLGTHMLNAMRQNMLADMFKRDAMYGLFRRIVEMIDSASIQIEDGSVFPCLNNFRTIMETLFQLEYLLLDPTPALPATVLEKSWHFQLAEFHNHLVTFEEALFDADLNVDKSGFQQLVDDLTNRIALPHFDSVRKSYLSSSAFKKKTREKQPVKWYALSIPGNSFRSLAVALKKVDLYTYYYGPASSFTHSSSLGADSFYYHDNAIYVTRIRSLDKLDDTAKAIIDLSIQAIRLVSKELLYKDRAAYLLAVQELEQKYKLAFNPFRKRVR